MKIVVTGGLGKVGRWVVRELTTGADGAATHEVLVFDQAWEAPAERVRCLAGDIRDLGQVVEALHGADAVIHLAGVSTHSRVSNQVTFQTNVIGTFNVHEAAWRLGIPRVVTMGSEAVLGWAPGAWVREVPPAYLPIDEEHPLRPQDAYGLSKQAGEAVAQSYTEKAGMETVTLRAPRIVTPEEMRQLREAGGITPRRFALFHYVDVRDLASACRLAVERPITGCNVFFAGSGETLVAEALSTLYPRLIPAIGDRAAALTGACGAVSIEKIKRTLGWAPKYSWRSGPL